MAKQKALGAAAALLLVGCAANNDPTDVLYGETTFVIAVNPAVNEANSNRTVPLPGLDRANLLVAVDGGPQAQTDSAGIVVLRRVQPGQRTITVSPLTAPPGADVGASINAMDLHEVAVAFNGGTAQIMSDVSYGFGGNVIEVFPSDPIGEVNNALGTSQAIVFFHGGRYVGNLEFRGSNTTLFGEGIFGGAVTLEGNIIVAGSNNRIRGAMVTGNLTVKNTASVSFSRVGGDLLVEGSDVVLLQNSVCGAATISGSNTTALGNAGLVPLPKSC